MRYSVVRQHFIHPMKGFVHTMSSTVCWTWLGESVCGMALNHHQDTSVLLGRDCVCFSVDLPPQLLMDFTSAAKFRRLPVAAYQQCCFHGHFYHQKTNKQEDQEDASKSTPSCQLTCIWLPFQSFIKKISCFKSAVRNQWTEKPKHSPTDSVNNTHVSV